MWRLRSSLPRLSTLRLDSFPMLQRWTSGLIMHQRTFLTPSQVYWWLKERMWATIFKCAPSSSVMILPSPILPFGLQLLVCSVTFTIVPRICHWHPFATEHPAWEGIRKAKLTNLVRWKTFCESFQPFQQAVALIAKKTVRFFVSDKNLAWFPCPQVQNSTRSFPRSS